MDSLSPEIVIFMVILVMRTQLEKILLNINNKGHGNNINRNYKQKSFADTKRYGAAKTYPVKKRQEQTS